MADSEETKKHKPTHRWAEEETSAFLSLMRGEEGELGLFERMKRKKLSRVKAMEEIASKMKQKGFDLSATTVDNKWKSLLSTYRQVEDHKNQSGNDRVKEGIWHQEVGDIVGERASTKPRTVVGSGIPFVPQADAEETPSGPAGPSSSSVPGYSPPLFWPSASAISRPSASQSQWDPPFGGPPHWLLTFPSLVAQAV